MLDVQPRIDHLACVAAEEVGRHLNGLPPAAQVVRVVRALGAVTPELSDRFIRLLTKHSLVAALTRTLAEYISTSGISVDIGLSGGELGAVVPPAARATERDDVVQHNAPSSTKSKQWHESVYRGLWYPAYQTAIHDLTTHDMALASAYLGGKLTQRGCPKSDKSKSAAKWNLAYRIVHGIESVAGMVAGLVLSVIYGPVAGLAVGYLHKAKMALMDRIWKLKVERDPVFRALVEKLQPKGWMSYGRFRYQMRPFGNLLVQELGCGRDLATRLRLHGRVIRMIDVLASSAPTARSRPGGYDYVSSFGMLKGSIFPPRGPKFDGVAPPPTVAAQVKALVASAPIQALIKHPVTAQHASLPVPPGLLQSAKLLEAGVARSVAASSDDRRAEVTQKSPSPAATPKRAAGTSAAHSDPLWLLLGGAALGAALLATR